MAFTQSTFAPVGAQSSAAPAVYSYSTPDNTATVTTAGYFTAKQNQLNEGDTIIAKVGDGNIELVVGSDTSTVTVKAAGAPVNEFDDDVFRIQNAGDDTKKIDFDASGITTATTRTITMPDSDVDLSLVQDSSKIVYRFYTEGTSGADSTSINAPASAPTLAEMTHTFTPDSASNIIRVKCSATFENSFDEGTSMVIFIGSTQQPNTHRRSYTGSSSGFHGSVDVFWEGTLPASSQTISVIFYVSAGTSTAQADRRQFSLEEIRV